MGVKTQGTTIVVSSFGLKSNVGINHSGKASLMARQKERLGGSS